MHEKLCVLDRWVVTISSPPWTWHCLKLAKMSRTHSSIRMITLRFGMQNYCRDFYRYSKVPRANKNLVYCREGHSVIAEGRYLHIFSINICSFLHSHIFILQKFKKILREENQPASQCRWVAGAC